MTTHYDILGIEKDATKDDIKKAYRSKVMKAHPDRGGDEEEFKRIQKAYDILRDPEKRTEYDWGQGKSYNPRAGYTRGRRSTTNKAAFTVDDLKTMWEEKLRKTDSWDTGEYDYSDEYDYDIFDDDNYYKTRKRKNKTTRITVAVNLSETMTETSKTISVKTDYGNEYDPIEIKIPRGVEDESEVVYRGVGDNTYPDVKRGDLIVKFVLVNDTNFILDPAENSDVHVNLITADKISMFDAILGTELFIKDIANKTYKLKIPAGTQSNTAFKMKGLGLYVPGSNARGDLSVIVNVTIPQLDDLSKEHQELILNSRKKG